MLQNELNADARKRYERHVKELEAFGHRGSTSDNEARAATYLCGELRAIGLEPSLEPFKGTSSLGLVLLLHVLVAGIGAIFLWCLPLLTILFGALSLTSFLVESTSRGISLGTLLRTRLSQNVSASIPARRGSPRVRIVILGHYDTQRTGILWKDRVAGKLAPLLNVSWGIAKSPVFPVTLAMVFQIVAGAMVLIWGYSGVSSVLGCVAIVIYAISGALLGQWASGPFVPGANDNATGASAVLALAESWLAHPVDDVEAVFLLPGCEETGLTGAAAWLDAHRSECRRTRTLFLNLDTLGCGSPRFVSRELSLGALPAKYPSEMLEIARAVAVDQGLEHTDPVQVPVPSDSIAFLMRGIGGVTIHSLGEGLRNPNYHQLTDTSDRIDFDLAWRAVTFAKGILQRMAFATRSSEMETSL